MGYGNVAPAPLIWTLPAPAGAASAMAAATASGMDVQGFIVCPPSPCDASEREQRVQRVALLVGLGQDGVVLDPLVVGQQRRRHALLDREPVRDAGDGALLAAIDALVELAVIVA